MCRKSIKIHIQLLRAALREVELGDEEKKWGLFILNFIVLHTVFKDHEYVNFKNLSFPLHLRVTRCNSDSSYHL